MRTAYSQTRLRRRDGPPPPSSSSDLGRHGGVTPSRRSLPDPMRTAYVLTRLRCREAPPPPPPPSSSSSTVSGAEHHRLPADIEYLILLRLPVKPLTRFKSACKPWYALISSPDFKQDHYRHSQGNPKFLILRNGVNYGTLDFHTFHVEGTPISKFSKTFPRAYHTHDILPIQSCLGLVCIAHEYDNQSVLICNPSTQELVALPPPGLQLISLCIGFGYAAATNQVKVVMFFCYVRDRLRKERCMVFTLGGSDWREARNPAPYEVAAGAAPFLNGALHLLPSSHWDCERENRYIAAFDVEREKCKRVPFPEYWHTIVEDHLFQPGLDEVCLNMLGGSLCLSILFGESDERKGNMELWLLKDYTNVEWVKGYNMDFSAMLHIPTTHNNWAHRVGIIVDAIVLSNILRKKRCDYLPYFLNDEEFTDELVQDCPGALYAESFFPIEIGQELLSSLILGTS